MNAVFLPVLLVLVVSMFDHGLTDQIDDRLRAEQHKLSQVVRRKCHSRPISIEHAAEAIESCAEPILDQASFIPHDLYPEKYRQVMEECLHQVSPEADVCEHSTMNQLIRCGTHRGFASLPKLRHLYERQKNRVGELIGELMNACTSAIEDL